MRKTMKYMAVSAAATVMVMGTFSISYAASGLQCPNCGYVLTGNANRPNTPGANNNTTQRGWVQKTVDRETVWNYYDNNGNMIKGQWFQSPDSGIWYYFDRDGVMATGWGKEREIEGYWFDSTGAMATGWRTISLEEEDTYGPGAGTGDKGYFYFTGSGKVAEGWTRIGDSWYFLNDGYVSDFADYQMVYGEVEIDGEEYYFGNSTDGSMKVGLVKVVSESSPTKPSSKNEERYYLYKDNGVRVRDGWGRYNNVWYFVDDEGEIVTDGFLALDSNDNMVESKDEADQVYYMDKNGVMKTGWVEVSEDKAERPGSTRGKINYYFNNSGRMETGWRKDGNRWYYLSKTSEKGFDRGQMVTGLYEVEEGSTYFFNTSGEMVTSAWKDVDGKHIYLNDDGVMYQASAGDYLVQKIGSRYYVFNDQSNRLTNSTIYKIGEKWTTDPTGAEEGKTKIYTINSSGVAKEGTYKK